MGKRRVSEAAPIQVYLDRQEQGRLERLASQLETTKSEVLRRGLVALERELLDPAAHPGLRLIGLAATEVEGASPHDPAREHDRLVADDEEAGWSSRRPGKRAGRGR